MTVEWRREPSDSHVERKILTGMIVSDEVLRRLSLVYKPTYMTSPFTRTVADWCLEYFRRYDKAPGPHIQDIYEFHKRDGLDQDQAQLIGRFLEGISKDHEREGQFNDGYVSDQAEEYFKERAVVVLRDTMDQHIQTGNWLEAHAAVAAFHQVETTLSMGFEPMADHALIRRAFEAPDALFTIPGALGRLIGPLERNFLLGVAAPYKRGKTWALGWFALLGLYFHCNVAFFTLEMPELRMVRRFLSALTGMPLKPPPRGGLLYPVWDCFHNQTGACPKPQRPTRAIVRPDGNKMTFHNAPKEYRPCSACRGSRDWKVDTWLEPREVETLTGKTAWEKAQAIRESSMGARFKMESWPPYSAGLSQIKATLQIWEYMDGFVPDIVIVDYADILKPEEKVDAERHKLDRIWKGLKAIAHERHCLMITATQTNKTTLDKPNMKQGDVSEDARKLGHVDAMIGINQTDQEKVECVSRVVVTAQRYEGFSMLSQATILQQLAAGQWCLDSEIKR